MTKEITYAITVYEYHSLDKEEYSLYGINKERVQQTINECLKENKSFRVAVFDGE
jgi:hypothetical protein